MLVQQVGGGYIFQVRGQFVLCLFGRFEPARGQKSDFVFSVTCAYLIFDVSIFRESAR